MPASALDDESGETMVIWVDADAWPKAAKELIARASARLGLPVRLVVHTADSIGERLAVRNLMEELRWAEVETGGPAAYSPADRQRFAQALDRLLSRPAS